MKIALVGDVALFGSFVVGGGNSLNINGVSQYLAQFDHVVANFEAPFSIRRKTWGAKSAYLCSDPANVELLRELHIDIVNVANNHMFDYGREGYECTKLTLEAAGIKWFGAEGRTVTVDGLVFDGYCCYSTNPLRLVDYGKYGLNRLDVREIERRLADYKAQSLLPVLAIHAGIEHVHTPSVDSIRMSRRWADAADYVYYGHHPHVMQGVERHGGSLIAHSLGNFIFDDNEHVTLSEANRSSAILEVEIDGGKIVSHRLTPIRIGKGRIEVLAGQESEFDCQQAVFDRALADSEAYTAERNAKRAEWVNERKRSRNLAWVLRRLRPRYAELWRTNRRNARLYRRHVN